jgi:translation initiation factor IF-3
MSRFSRDQGGPPQRTRVNFMIRITPIRVIGPDESQLGVIETNDAIKKAQEMGLDLVEISPDARPPVCKIMDYGKYKYELSQKARKSRAASKSSELKELRLGRSVKIGEHDIQIRIDQARNFLMHGHKVMFTQKFKGREIAHKDLGLENLAMVRDALADIAKIESPPRLFGKQYNMIVAADRAKVEAIKRKLEKERQEKLAKGEKVADLKSVEQLEAELAAEKHDDEGDDE